MVLVNSIGIDFFYENEKEERCCTSGGKLSRRNLEKIHGLLCSSGYEFSVSDGIFTPDTCSETRHWKALGGSFFVSGSYEHISLLVSSIWSECS